MSPENEILEMRRRVREIIQRAQWDIEHEVWCAQRRLFLIDITILHPIRLNITKYRWNIIFNRLQAFVENQQDVLKSLEELL